MNALLSLNKYNESIKCYDKAIELDPKWAVPWNGKGNALLSLNRYNESTRCFDKAIELDPKYANPWNGKGANFAAIGKYAESIRCFNKSIELNPQDAGFWMNKGSAFADQHEYEEAIKAFNRAIELNSSNAEAWYNIGRSLDDLSKHNEAIKAYDKAIDLDPLDPDFWYSKSLALKSIGKINESNIAINRSRSLSLIAPTDNRLLALPESASYDIIERISLNNTGINNTGTIHLIVALIHDISPYQKVISKEFSTIYDEIFTDSYSNQFARFELVNLAPGDRRNIEIHYRIVVQSQLFDLNQCNGTFHDESANSFVDSEPFIESGSNPIINLTNQLANDKITPCEKSKAFYDYVADNMRYTPHIYVVQGALAALNNLSGVCSAYSDLLAALNRAAGIPARTLHGLTCCNGNETHVWLDVYLPAVGWVPMDPTWGRYPGKRDLYFAKMPPDHIIINRGRNIPSLGGYNYYYLCTWEQNGAIIASKATWSVEA